MGRNCRFCTCMPFRAETLHCIPQKRNLVIRYLGLVMRNNDFLQEVLRRRYKRSCFVLVLFCVCKYIILICSCYVLKLVRISPKKWVFDSSGEFSIKIICFGQWKCRNWKRFAEKIQTRFMLVPLFLKHYRRISTTKDNSNDMFCHCVLIKLRCCYV